MARSCKVYVAICKISQSPVFANTVKYEFKRQWKEYPFPNNLTLWSLSDNKLESIKEILPYELQ